MSQMQILYELYGSRETEEWRCDFCGGITKKVDGYLVKNECCCPREEIIDEKTG
jgi:hypothetical protein